MDCDDTASRTALAAPPRRSEQWTKLATVPIVATSQVAVTTYDPCGSVQLCSTVKSSLPTVPDAGRSTTVPWSRNVPPALLPPAGPAGPREPVAPLGPRGPVAPALANSAQLCDPGAGLLACDL